MRGTDELEVGMTHRMKQARARIATFQKFPEHGKLANTVCR